MVHTVHSAAIVGLDALPVRVEVALRRGTPVIGIVGLAPAAARECRERFRAAAAQLGLRVPGLRITVNLAPAHVRKDGSAFDLPVAVAVLAASGRIPTGRAANWALAGELGLDGTVRPIRGVLPMALRIRALRTIEGLIVPVDNLPEARSVRGLRILGARDLGEVISFFRGEADLTSGVRRGRRPLPTSAVDFSEIVGHAPAKRALEIAAAGGHNVLLTGAPGAGKTMLARTLPGILPRLSTSEAIEVTALHSVAGQLPAGGGLLEQRPFRAPHHTVTTVGLVGGGAPVRPGEVSLAHRGVLFADELPEFRTASLEALRQPLEDGRVHITRARETHAFPARFLFIGAMNPCRCGRLSDPERSCQCDPGEVRRYRARLSGPLLDRIDIHVDVPVVGWPSLSRASGGPESPDMRERVNDARLRAGRRFPGEVRTNAELTPAALRKHCLLDTEGDSILRAASIRYGFSARACHRVIRVARTIADLDRIRCIGADHLAEALNYRLPDPD